MAKSILIYTSRIAIGFCAISVNSSEYNNSEWQLYRTFEVEKADYFFIKLSLALKLLEYETRYVCTPVYIIYLLECLIANERAVLSDREEVINKQEDTDYLKRINGGLKNVGKIIKDARIEKGLSQKELADIVDISDSTISSIEAGKNVEVISRLSEILKAVGVKIYFTKQTGERILVNSTKPAFPPYDKNRPKYNKRFQTHGRK